MARKTLMKWSEALSRNAVSNSVGNLLFSSWWLIILYERVFARFLFLQTNLSFAFGKYNNMDFNFIVRCSHPLKFERFYWNRSSTKQDFFNRKRTNCVTHIRKKPLFLTERKQLFQIAVVVDVNDDVVSHPCCSSSSRCCCCYCLHHFSRKELIAKETRNTESREH